MRGCSRTYRLASAKRYSDIDGGEISPPMGYLIRLWGVRRSTLLEDALHGRVDRRPIVVLGTAAKQGEDPIFAINNWPALSETRSL